MENNQEKESFSFIYSAKQQEEIRNIRKKYAPPEEDKMEQLRRLDASVTQKARIVSLSIGIIGVFLLGIGMCCVMVWDKAFFLGIVLGILGIGAMITAYPVFVHLTKKQRKKLAPEILRLTEELMK